MRTVRYAHYPSIPAFRIDEDMERRANEIISKRKYRNTSDASRDIFMHGLRAIEILSDPAKSQKMQEALGNPFTQENLEKYSDNYSITELRKYRDLLDARISVRIDKRQEQPIRYDAKGRRKL